MPCFLPFRHKHVLRRALRLFCKLDQSHGSIFLQNGKISDESPKFQTPANEQSAINRQKALKNLTTGHMDRTRGVIQEN